MKTNDFGECPEFLLNRIIKLTLFLGSSYLFDRMRIAELEQEKRAREATEAWETSLLRKQATQGYMYQNPESRLPSRSHMTPVTMAMEVPPLKPPGSPSKMVTVTVAMPEPLVNGVSHSSILNSFGSSPRDHNNSSSSGNRIFHQLFNLLFRCHYQATCSASC